MPDYFYPDVTLVVFTKAPIPGFCKTRLIPELGEQGAADLQQELTEHCIHQLCHQPLCKTQIWCSPDISHPLFQSLAKQYSVSLHKQQGNNLGERMYHAMSNQDTPYTIIVGSDIPLLTGQYLAEAIKILSHGADVVLGPAEDGGYVLLGLRQVPKALFQDIKWGSNTVFTQTTKKLDATGLVWQAIEPLWDVDNETDFRRFKALKFALQN